jgi:hypothetical protein
VSTYSDPNREALGLAPIWTGAETTEPPVEPPPTEPPPEEPEVPADDEDAGARGGKARRRS